jgi:hypothetical protein
MQARSRVLTSVRPLMRPFVAAGPYGVRRSVPNLIHALEAPREQLADRSRLLTVRHTFLRPSCAFGVPNRSLRYAAATGA